MHFIRNLMLSTVLVTSAAGTAAADEELIN
jgi:hypothetical protein